MEDTLIVIIVLVIAAAITLVIRWAVETYETAKMKFNDLKKFYPLNPGRWTLHDDCVWCETNKHIDCFSFGFIDYYRYKLWRHKKKCEKNKKDDLQAISRMLDVVKEDVENSQRKAAEEQSAAIAELLKHATTCEILKALEEMKTNG